VKPLPYSWLPISPKVKGGAGGAFMAPTEGVALFEVKGAYKDSSACGLEMTIGECVLFGGFLALLEMTVGRESVFWGDFSLCSK